MIDFILILFFGTDMVFDLPTRLFQKPVVRKLDFLYDFPNCIELPFPGTQGTMPIQFLNVQKQHKLFHSPSFCADYVVTEFKWQAER